MNAKILGLLSRIMGVIGKLLIAHTPKTARLIITFAGPMSVATLQAKRFGVTQVHWRRSSLQA